MVIYKVMYAKVPNGSSGNRAALFFKEFDDEGEVEMWIAEQGFVRQEAMVMMKSGSIWMEHQDQAQFFKS